jgi:4-amino-4-deoxy-L-arabinose transferase-like glycosyltransferase
MFGRVPRPLALLLGVAALLSVAWTFTLTPFQGPDEPAHFSYAQYVAETGGKPSVTGGDHPYSTETAGALYFFNLNQLAGVSDARPAWAEVEERRFAAIDARLGEESEEDGAGPNPLGKNPPLYYAYEAVPYWVGSLGSFWDRLIVMRLASGLLLLATVVFTWLAAAEVFRAMWPRVLATGCVTLLPQLTAMSGTVNADNLLVAVWTAFAYVSLRLVRHGPNVKRMLALAALAGASLLTHGRGIAILPALLAIVAIAVLRTRPRPKQLLAALAPGAALLAIVVGAYRLLLAPSTGAYGGEVTLTHGSAGMSVRGFLSSVWRFYFPGLPLMEDRVGQPFGYRQMFIESFFGRFASLEVAFSPAVYTLIQALCAVGLIGLAAVVAGRWAAVRARWAEVATLAVLTVSMLGLLHLASYRSLVGTNDPLITGRYLLPLVAVFGLTVAFVLSSLRPRASALAGTAVLAGLLALNLSGLMLTFTRFYG